MKLVTRSEWGARQPKSATPSTATKVAIHFEGPLIGSRPHSECAGLVRGIQNFHMDVAEPPDHFADIAYNALVCEHGFVFEGRGKGVRTGANGTTESNKSHLAICYLGGMDENTGETDPFTNEAKNAINDAAEFLGVTDTVWVPHKKFVATACPGPVITEWVNGGHPRSSAREEDELTQDEKNTLRFIAQVLEELKSFYGRFDPQGQKDFFRGMDEAARIIKSGAN